MLRFFQSAILPVPAADLAAWHFRPGALERLVPPWSGVRVRSTVGSLRNGAVASLEVPFGPFHRRWDAVHEEVVEGHQFVDRMTKGPLRSWRHLHRFLPADEHPQPASRLEDAIEYELPFGAIGRLGVGQVEQMLHRTFEWRHRRTREDLRRHAESPGPRLTVGISGASGLVGGALAAFLTTGGHRVRRLVRGGAHGDADAIAWDPQRGTIDEFGLASCDAVVHLAGASIAGRWTDARKRAIRESRVVGTRLIAEALARGGKRTGVLVSASAIGYYGDRGIERVDESTSMGSGFLAEVCREWEEAARPARDAGLRTVALRIGMVLAGNGGALGSLRLPFSLGLGGPVGSGRQGVSWIAIDDLIAAILFAIREPAMEGPVNAVAPQPCDNRTFGRTLAAVLRRPAFVPAPGPAVRLLLGEMGRELLLAGAFVEPSVLSKAGFRFGFPGLEAALRFELGRLQG